MRSLDLQIFTYLNIILGGFLIKWLKPVVEEAIFPLSILSLFLQKSQNLDFFQDVTWHFPCWTSCTFWLTTQIHTVTKKLNRINDVLIAGQEKISFILTYYSKI